MSLLRVLSLRDLLLQHLLLDHEAVQPPLGGLHPELRQAMREMGHDYELPVSEDCFRRLQQRTGLLQLNIQPQKDAAGPRPLLVVTGLFTARPGQASPCFKAVSARLTLSSGEKEDSNADQVWRAVRSLNHRDSVVGILHEQNP